MIEMESTPDQPPKNSVAAVAMSSRPGNDVSCATPARRPASGTSTQTNQTKGRNSLPAGLTSPWMPAEHSAVILTTMHVVDNKVATWLSTALQRTWPTLGSNDAWSSLARKLTVANATGSVLPSPPASSHPATFFSPSSFSFFFFLSFFLLSLSLSKGGLDRGLGWRLGEDIDLVFSDLPKTPELLRNLQVIAGDGLQSVSRPWSIRPILWFFQGLKLEIQKKTLLREQLG